MAKKWGKLLFFKVYIKTATPNGSPKFLKIILYAICTKRKNFRLVDHDFSKNACF